MRKEKWSGCGAMNTLRFCQLQRLFGSSFKWTWVHRKLLRYRTSYYQPMQVTFPLCASNSSQGIYIINAMYKASSAASNVERRKLVCLPANHRYPLCFQVFQRQIQVEYRLCSCANYKYRRATQLGQVRRDIHRCLRI